MVLEFIRSESHPDNIFFINANSLQDKIDLGALLSRYSRSHKDAETLYNEEFLTNPNRGVEFYAKVFGQYDDESISELVPHGFAVCLENIPILWSTYLLHYRTLSAIEKSIRYVKAFDYYKPVNSIRLKLYDTLCEKRIHDYTKAHVKAYSQLSSKLQPSELEKPAVKRALNARALDETRDLLPLSTLTSLGIMANLRSWLNILTKEKVRNNPSVYTAELIDPLTGLFKQYFPTIFSQDKLDYLTKAEDTIFMSKLKTESKIEFNEYEDGLNPNLLNEFELKYSPDIDLGLNYGPYINAIERVKKIKPVRETEMLDITIAIPGIDIATFRDVQRHRYFTILINKWDSYQSNDDEFILLSSPLSTLIDITIKGNLRQWTHTIELRTQEQGHPNYRRIFQSCGILIAKHLGLNKEELFPYADWRSDEEIGLGRLKAELKKKDSDQDNKDQEELN
ncbi:MAG: FAD-dependent thymidylate synthase [Candidatus Nitrosocosmicus sp.]